MYFSTLLDASFFSDWISVRLSLFWPCIVAEDKLPSEGKVSVLSRWVITLCLPSCHHLQCTGSWPKSSSLWPIWWGLVSWNPCPRICTLTAWTQVNCMFRGGCDHIQVGVFLLPPPGCQGAGLTGGTPLSYHTWHPPARGMPPPALVLVNSNGN